MADNPTRAALRQRILELESKLEELSSAYAVLRDNSARYETLIEHMPNEAHVWQLVRDDQGKIRTWRLSTANRAALNVWGMKLEDIVGKTTDEIFLDAKATETFLPIVEKIFADNKPLLWERFFEGTGQVLQMLSIPAEEHFFSTGVDVTEMRRMEASIKHTEKMDAIGQLAGGIAHDFNNQLAGILGYAELLEGALIEPELLEAVRNIIKAAQRSSDLTHQLLAFARRGPADFAPVNIETLVNDTISLLKHTLNKNIAIDCQVDTQPANVLGDLSLLGNALLNIAINASDAMPEGGDLSFTGRRVYLDAEDRTAAKLGLKCGEYFRLDIRDTGCGIPAEAISLIFDPFYTTKPSGHGMGLASVHGTLLRHGGNITVRSEVGAGSCFTLFLPTTSEKTQPKTMSIDKLPGISPPLCIIVVDDETALRKLYQTLLSRHGHHVETFGSGTEALSYYRDNWQHIDLAILDMNMPGQNGLETLKAMQEINASIKALIATGYWVETTSKELQKYGALFWLQKPFRERDLLDAIVRATSLA